MIPTKKIEMRYLFLAFLSILLLFLFRLSFMNSSIHVSDSSYLFIHTILELFSIFVSFSIFSQARVTFTANPTYYFLGLVFLAVGLFDLLHTLSYKGMPYLNDELASARATWFWIIARLTESVGVALFIMAPKRLIGKNRLFGFSIAFTITLMISSVIIYIPDRLPILIGESGLTSLKISLEYVITLINLTTLIILMRKYRLQPNINSLRFMFGIFLIMVAELFFTLYIHVYDIENTIGHIFKAFGYLYLYRSIFYPHIQSILSSKERAEQRQKEAESKLVEIKKNLSQQIFEAHEEERKRVSRELHDGIGQSLYSILITLNTMRKEPSLEKKNAIIDTVRTITEDSMKEVKTIAHSLRPSTLDDLGFIPTLRSYLESYKKIHQTDIRFEITGNIGRLKADVETALYRICQEALTNAAKYANATHINVNIHIDDKEALLHIQDNGTGFPVEEYMKDNKQKGIGLFSIQERAEGLGGSAHISSALNHGTTISVRIPRMED